MSVSRTRELEALQRSQDLAAQRRAELSLHSPEAKAARRAERARVLEERRRLALAWWVFKGLLSERLV
jgi:hypothetical protein